MSREVFINYGQRIRMQGEFEILNGIITEVTDGGVPCELTLMGDKSLRIGGSVHPRDIIEIVNDIWTCEEIEEALRKGGIQESVIETHSNREGRNFHLFPLMIILEK